MGDLNGSASKELIFDMTMILMEKKLEISKAVSMLKEVIVNNLGGGDRNFEELVNDLDEVSS